MRSDLDQIFPLAFPYFRSHYLFFITLICYCYSLSFRYGTNIVFFCFSIVGSTSATISETENLLSDFFSLPCCSARERETLLGLCFFVDSVIQWKFSASFSSEDWIAYTINWEIRGSNWSPIGCDIFSAAVEFLDPSLRASNWCSRSSPVVVNSGPETHDPEQKCCSVLFWF